MSFMWGCVGMKDEARYKEIIDFIKTFQDFDKHGDITELFTKRYCCIFSYILYKQFPEGEVWWDEERRHCLFKLGDYFFDITGLTIFTGKGSLVKSVLL